MSKVEVNQISSQCGSTLTIGQSGDTVTLAAGATQTGFGRTGTVDWDTTAKTASFTAVSGNGYFVNTTSGAITVTLPTSPSAGDIVAVADYAGTAATNNITIARNGSNFEGGTENGIISTNRQTATFVYVDGTQGWVVVNSNDQSFQTPAFITATGGTVTCCGDYKIHTFTSPGTFCVSCAGNPVGSNTVDYLVVAGGGAGGTGYSNNTGKMGGGGAGGYRESSGAASGCYSVSPLGTCVSALPVTATAFPIQVGGGGAAASPTSQTDGNNGSNSIFSTITSSGGGGGGASNPGTGGVAGGSGGGGAYGTEKCAGAGNTPPVSPPQGNSGGTGLNCSPFAAGGGGGATAAGTSGTNPASGPGGAGATTSISGSPTTYAGGGGGSGRSDPNIPAAKGTGGTGGGGAGGCRTGTTTATPGVSGTANTGGGGGAGNPAGDGDVPAGSVTGSGGSGIVIIRYKYQ